MQKFRFKDSRQGTGIYYILKIRRSYGNITAIEYTSNPNCSWGGGLTFAQNIEIINDYSLMD